MHTVNQPRIGTCAFVFLDHQPWVAFPAQSIGAAELVDNVSGLAKVARAQTMLSARGAGHEVAYVADCSGGLRGWEGIRRARAGRPDGPNLGAKHSRSSGYGEHSQRRVGTFGRHERACWISSQPLSLEAHHEAKRRMSAARAIPLTWPAVMAELCLDNTAPEYQALHPVVLQHGAGVGPVVQHDGVQLGRGR